MSRLRRVLRTASVLAGSLLIGGALSSAAEAGLPKIPSKVKDKAKQKAEQKAEQVLEQKQESAEPEAAGEAEVEAEHGAAGDAATAAPAPAAAAGSADDMTLYTKYDFVPGDRVVFYDDLASDEVGEFPHRWRLKNGVFEVAKYVNEPWILCTNEGTLQPDLPDGLPERYTVEMEIWDGGADTQGHWHYLKWLNADGQVIGEFALKDHRGTSFYLNGEQKADKALPQPLTKGKHVMRAMVTATSIKCYLDHERVANIPKVSGWQPVAVAVTLDPWTEEKTPLLLRGFRLAEGGKTLRDQLAETGRIVTHGILFDSGSAVIKAESYKTLALIAELVTADPALKLSIEGHTDSDGVDAENLALSQKRADAVKAWLVAQGTAADRLTTQGQGETKPIDVNTTPEGKANNRRVELAKL